jgi:TRAP-type C4-dicarboxylate transport system permease small subunit
MDRLEERIFNIFEKLVATICVVSMVFVLFLQVFTRYVLKVPLYWSEELARIILIWSVFLGANLAFRAGTHMRIDILSRKLPKSFRMVSNMIAKTTVTAFSVVLVVHGWDLSRKMMRIIAPATGIPVGLIDLILPIFALLTIIIVWMHPYREL